ncbi:MAG: MotA/TolQ/ExbB proton channel family protein, partial [Solirubrobacterales bacterium]
MNLIYATSVGDTITNSVADVAEALRYPVLITAMIALLVVAYELGRLAVETWKRSQLPKTPFEQVSRHAIAQTRAGDTAGAQATLKSYTYNDQLQKAAVGTLFATNAIDAQRAVIDYDLYVSKRLDRVRLLVRAGPALGLMGTLIPLSPALAALGRGEPNVLADELQTAFSITVVGVLVGLVAFTIALVRERFFTKDLADLEFLRELRGDAATITPATVPQPSAAAPSHLTATDQPVAASQIAAEETLVIPTPAQPAPAAAPA